ncbi:MAG: ImuA family protein [Sphingobacterium sp.]|uniref:ImuA family protein n=1 Tax=Sphingobacterium sp. JB170 TaxID=1434842 RepID=UPI000B34D542|nr:hypothetical protein [Sphingobacterium sp. JB170]
MVGIEKKEIIKKLQQEILSLEGFKSATTDLQQEDIGFQLMADAFPRHTFPKGTIHEFISQTAACATAVSGFVSSILSILMNNDTPCLWISTKRSLFPAGLGYFGVQPDKIIFIDITKDKEALWVMEQALKCSALSAVVAELSEVSFTESQRLQLAVEKSQVTGFLHRRKPRRENTLACTARWKITPLASYTENGLPGVGFPLWEVNLEKIRGGKPRKWALGWRDNKFISIAAEQAPQQRTLKKQAVCLNVS